MEAGHDYRNENTDKVRGRKYIFSFHFLVRDGRGCCDNNIIKAVAIGLRRDLEDPTDRGG